MSMPSIQEVEQWIEAQIPPNIAQLPSKVSQTAYDYYTALYNEITRYGPDLGLPSMAEIEQQLEQHFPEIAKYCPQSAHLVAPPPPPKTAWQQSLSWINKNRRCIQIASGLLIVGLGTHYSYQRGLIWLPGLGKKQKVIKQGRTPLFKNGVRKEAVIVMGADHPLGRAIALHLSSLGFIVIASVSSHAALSTFNSIIPPSSRGYIKALLFETSDVAGSLSKFVRSLDEVLKLRFPLLSAGDPYAAPGDEVSLVGVVNMMSYVAQEAVTSSPISASSFQINPAELAEAMERHVVASLCAITALQPLLTTAPRSFVVDANGRKEVLPPASTVITLLSSPSSHTSLPGAGKESVIAQATAAGIETIRREADDRAGKEKNTTSSSVYAGAAKRQVRVTTLEVDEGLPWGYALMADHDDRDKTPTASGFGRPGVNRRTSSGSQWSQRDVPAQVVLSRLSSLLLTPHPHARLKARYRVYLPRGRTDSIIERSRTILHRGTQRLMSIIPTTWVDVLLALRRNVSLRRAGLIGQGPRGRGVSASSSSSTIKPSTARAGPGPASSTHLRSSVRPPTGLHPPASHTAFPDSDEGENYSGMSGPPSLPDSNSGESHDGMISSGVLSVSSHEGSPPTKRSPLVGVDNATSDGSSSTSTMNAASQEGPWIGPEDETRHEEEDHDEEEETIQEDPASSTRRPASSLEASSHESVGDSWIQLSGSQTRENEE